MTWSRDGVQGQESSKIADILVPYLQGKGLDLGCGPYKVWPTCIGVDSCKDYGGQRPQGVDIVAEADNLSMFSDASMDYIFSSHLLEHIVDYKAVLKEWWRVIKPGGYLALYLPHKNFYPNIGQDGANPDHKHDFLPDDIIEAMKEIGSWEMLENEERGQNNEYSFLQIWRKKAGKGSHKFNVWQRNPEGKKRCLVIRYGAIGDAIMAASVLPELKKQGYYVTVNCTSKTKEVLQHDPNVDEWFIQEQDFVPNLSLGPYWAQIKFNNRYDKIINLCESIEGGLLTLPGRLQHEYPPESRRKMFGHVNYLERTHDIADVPYVFSPKFYSSDEETAWAKRMVKSCDGPVIAWAINGSALHKVYPWLQVVTAWLLKKTPAHVFLLGDAGQSLELQKAIVHSLEKDGVDMKRLHQTCGKWKLRETLTFVKHAHCVIGPETGTLNAASVEPVPKVIYLSHSSKENLTKHWKNTITLAPEQSRCPCYPCHRLIYGWDNCNQNETTQAAQCASSIAPEHIFDAVVEAVGLEPITTEEKKKRKKPKASLESFITAKPESMVAVEAA